MSDHSTAAGTPNIGHLILQCKYGTDTGRSREIAAELAEALVHDGKYSVLIDTFQDPSTPPFLAEMFRARILEAAFTAFRVSGSKEPLRDLATREDIPLDIAQCAGVALANAYDSPYDEKKLREILGDKQYHDDARVEAGKHICRHAQENKEFSTLFDLTVSADVIYDVRKPAGHSLIELAVASGNYPILLRLDAQKALPVNIRIELDGKVESAARKAIELAYSEGDFAILQEMSEDRRLPHSIRGRAEGCLFDLTHEKPKAVSDARPEDAAAELSRGPMTAELMYRLGKTAGTAHSSTNPPPSDRSPVSRLKR